MKIISLPAFTFVGPTTNSSSELFVLNTKWDIRDILEWIETEAAWLKRYNEDDVILTDFDLENAKILSGPDALLHLWDSLPEYIGCCYWAEGDDEFREDLGDNIALLDKFPPFTELMLQALGNLPRDTINKYNLATLPFSCPAHSLETPEMDEVYSSCCEYLPENPGEIRHRWEVYDNLRKQHIKSVRAQLVEWIRANKEGLDILLPKIVILPSTENNSVGYELFCPIISKFSGIHLHLG